MKLARVVFVTYLSIITVGLAAAFVIGLTGR